MENVALFRHLVGDLKPGLRGEYVGDIAGQRFVISTARDKANEPIGFYVFAVTESMERPSAIVLGVKK